MVEITAVENIQTRKNAQSCQLDERFLFTSPTQSFITEGCFKRITLPLLDSDAQQGTFQQQLSEYFTAARAAGITAPRLVGAIPFDSQQASELFIPTAVTQYSRETLKQHYIPLAEKPLANVTSQTAFPEQAEFMSMVTQAVTAMKSGQLDKVVLSRLLQLTTDQPVNSTSLMARIMAQNPDNYHFHVPLSTGQVLTGASPELLLRKQAQHYRSCPLAGSARRHNSPAIDQRIGEQLLQSTKDRHEHQLVVDAMQEVLQPLSVGLDIPSTPSLITTSQLWHLASDIKGQVADDNENALRLAGQLHPTPALSGFPHQTACKLIGQLEPFSRHLFGGMVGWCDDQGNGEWVVTIRCAQLNAKQVTLFAGAGIVAASDPFSEWQETGTKLSTMLTAFGLQ